MKIAFVGIGQSYASHVWMRRMRDMLGDRLVVNIDDLRNVERGAKLADDLHYVPRKPNRLKRAMRVLHLTNLTSGTLRSAWMLDKIRKSNASLVFVHFLDYAAQFNDVWSRLGIPVVVHCHGYDITWDVKHHLKKSRLHPADYLDRVRAMPENVWFIANSTYTQSQLEKIGINPDKIYIKRFGVPIADRPGSRSTAGAQKVLYLGRLVDFKGPLETVRAFGRIASEYPKASLQIAGGGELSDELSRVIDGQACKDRIHRHGPVDQASGAQLRRESIIFTAHNKIGDITGQQEAFGVSMLEAMGEGIPVVTGRSGGLTDFVKHDQNGLLFEPGDVEAHAGMLSELLASPEKRERLGREAWETVRSGYQLEHEKADLDRIFADVSRIGSRVTLSQKFAAAA